MPPVGLHGTSEKRDGAAVTMYADVNARHATAAKINALQSIFRFLVGFEAIGTGDIVGTLLYSLKWCTKSKLCQLNPDNETYGCITFFIKAMS